MSEKKKIFISSVQKEFKDERRALKNYIQGDPLFRQCAAAGLRKPEFKQEAGSFIQILWRPRQAISSPIMNQKTQPEPGVEPGVESGVESRMAFAILGFLKKASLGKKEIASNLGKPKTTRYLNDLISKMVHIEFIEYTIPQKPNSRLQKYRITKKGRDLLTKQTNESVKGATKGPKGPFHQKGSQRAQRAHPSSCKSVKKKTRT